MRRQQRQPERLSTMPRGKQFRGSDDVAEALRHLLAAHVDKPVVHPEARERLPTVRAAALRDFILMVREDEVESAAVDVDGLAKVALDHRRTFDVPARPSPAPRRI